VKRLIEATPQRRRFFAGLCLAILVFIATAGLAQNVVSGEITGTVTDASGAVVPNATVNLSNTDTGVNQNTTTGSSGGYRFPLLRPGTYKVTANAAGFGAVSHQVVVSLGQVTDIPLQLAVAGSTQIVEVTAESPLLHTDNANIATTYNTTEIDLIPSPGQDITNYAFSAPGVTLSTGAGYGNFTAFGLPGTSNLYTVNGNDYNDPYLNLNNSGASNLLLGANELQEISVVNNGYTGEYGRAAGANVNYTTKSGSNSFHGNAAWFWNGNTLNANDWFNNNTTPITPRPHEVSNQWAGSFGGPIVKNKVFFFYDNEGLRYVLPGGGLVYVPSQQFETAAIANLNATNPGAVSFYNNIFKLYNGAPGASRATPVSTGVDPGQGCGDIYNYDPTGSVVLSSSQTSIPVGTPCALTFRSTVNNLNTERLQSIRVDYNATDKDKLNFRYKQDRGIQATGTDPINAVFNANSVQPEDDGQVNWTHQLNDRMVNQFIASGLYYSAIFGPTNLPASLAAFPTTITFVNDGLYNNMGGSDNSYPQGRNVTQWQLVDDYSWTNGAHGIKFGVNLRRNDITSFAAGPNTSGLITINSMTDFFNGTAGNGSLYGQSFAKALEQPVAYYSLGLYVQDEWKATSKLKLTLALRADRNSNEVCQTSCFARPSGSFSTFNHSASTPYNQTILTGLQNAFPKIDGVQFGPRAGFAYSLTPSTVIRGGMGLFTDLYQGLIADRFITELPNVTSFTIQSGALAPGVSGNVFSQAAANNAALQAAFSSGGTLASIQQALPSFTPPNINTIVGNLHNPKYLEWNLEVERSIGDKTSVSLNYVGNHGNDLFTRNLGLNSYCRPRAASQNPMTGVITPAKCPNGFQDLPASAPDSRFGVVTELNNQGISNYDGVVATVVRKFSYGFQGSLSYTYSHSLDDISNGGLEPYNLLQTANSFRVAIDPYNLSSRNYGNSDYDFPHSLAANYYWQIPVKSTSNILNQLIGGWSVGGTFYAKSGEPFSVYSTTLRGIQSNGSSNIVLANFAGGGYGNCSHPSFDNSTALQCLSKSQFPIFTGTGLGEVYQSNWGNVARNSFRGPGYFNTDLQVVKNFKLTERFTFSLGANAFNILNHPNFANPTGSLSSATFGQITQTVTPPNSPYGNFQGAAVSGRVLQLQTKIRF